MGTRVISFSVVRDFRMFRQCLTDNPNCQNVDVQYVDNSQENVGIAKRYNDFLDKIVTDDDSAWIVFCHEDFELREPIAPLLEKLSTDSIYGPVGARTTKRFWVFTLPTIVGRISESKKDGTDEQIGIGALAATDSIMDATDCCCLIVHTSLIRRYNLRFDERLPFDLYSEDFCGAARIHHGVETRLLTLKCCHHSRPSKLPKSYVKALRYLNWKYRGHCFSGTCTCVGNCLSAWGFAWIPENWIMGFRSILVRLGGG